MTIPFWAVAIGCVLPYVWLPFTFPARARLDGGLDNRRPREQQGEITGGAARAVGAHKNAFEALVTFTAAVVVSHLAGADPGIAQWLAIVWVVARCLHGVFYIFDIHPLRSLMFTVSFACTLALFLLPLW